MKKTLFYIGLLTCLFPLTPLYGQNEEAAIVLKDLDHPQGCYATSLTTMNSPGPLLYTEDQIHTVSNSKGNIKLVCHFDLPEEVHLSRPFKDSGFLCGIGHVDTMSRVEFAGYRITHSLSGNVLDR